MHTAIHKVIPLAAMAAVSTPATAEALSPISSRDGFVQVITSGELRRFGIRLTVTPDGRIAGRAFGTPVTGAWQWSNGYFCRDLVWGETDLGYNCQLVEIDGSTIRFTSDQGAGEFADFTLR